MLVSYSPNSFGLIKGNVNLFMHSNIVNWFLLLYYVHTVPEQHWRTAAIFLYHSLSSFKSVSFCVFVTLIVLFWGALIDCDKNVTRATELVLDKTRLKQIVYFSVPQSLLVICY